MLIYAIDDEPNMLYLLHEAIAEAAPEAEILDFLLGTEALARMEKGDAIPDVVFSDIQMPGVSGLELAARMILGYPDAGCQRPGARGADEGAVAGNEAGFRNRL